MMIRLIDEFTVRLAPWLMVLSLFVGVNTHAISNPKGGAIALLGFMATWIMAPRVATLIAMGFGAWVIGMFVGGSLAG
jgi:hypothetical protein